MKKFYSFLIVFTLVFALGLHAQTPRFKILAIGEGGGHHVEYTKAAKVWLNKLAADSNFAVDYGTNFRNVNKTIQLVKMTNYGKLKDPARNRLDTFRHHKKNPRPSTALSAATTLSVGVTRTTAL